MNLGKSPGKSGGQSEENKDGATEEGDEDYGMFA